MAIVSNWVAELTTTTGTGDIALGGALSSYAAFSNMPDGEVWYSILSGENREAGIGTLVNGKTLQRTSPAATLYNGIYSSDGVSPIALTGKSQVYCTFNKTAFDEFAAKVEEAPDDGLLYGRKSSAWEVVSTSIIGDNPPAQANIGDFWYNTSDAQTYIYIDDGTSLQWVNANPVTSLPASSIEVDTANTQYTYGDAQNIFVQIDEILEANSNNISVLQYDYSNLVDPAPYVGSAGLIRTNSNEIAEDITIPANTNGTTAGPVQINDTFTVTVSDGSTWTIL